MNDSEQKIVPETDAGNKKVNPLVYFGGTTEGQGVSSGKPADPSSAGKKVFIGIVLLIVVFAAAYFLLTKVFRFPLPFTIPTF